MDLQVYSQVHVLPKSHFNVPHTLQFSNVLPVLILSSSTCIARVYTLKRIEGLIHYDRIKDLIHCVAYRRLDSLRYNTQI